jgi:two-component system, OmpR family, response regulator
VLGRPREIYDRSVDVHVSNLRKKLAGCSNGEVEIETIRGVGYRLRLRA